MARKQPPPAPAPPLPPVWPMRLVREPAPIDHPEFITNGRPQFKDLLFRRAEPWFYAFDLLTGLLLGRY